MSSDVLDTVVSAPRATIVPSALRESGGARALALLRDLATASGTTSQLLRQGEVIGEGGMGIVRTAEQVSLGRVVAVKTLKPERRDPASALDLLREAWVTGTIEHPNVVPVHYVGAEPDGSPLIVLKRIEGVEWSVLAGDAAEVQRRFGATDLLAWNLGILMQVLNALRFAHHRNVIHRDLKPSNVMIGDFGEVYLLDWGIAVALHDDGSGRLPLADDATQLAGTPCYMAPEMLGRETGPKLSERTDVYLAGSVLFELVTGNPPHLGTTAIEVLASVIESRPVLPPTIPVELARICMRAMHVDPDQRFDSVEALRLAVQSYLEHRGSANLGARAQERLDELLRALAGTDVDHEAISRLFGAARFGFHEALAVWRDNAEARAGLTRATIAVAEYELAQGNPDTAVVMLGELEEPPLLLARAREASAARAKRDADAEKLLAAHDKTTGQRTRSIVLGGLGAVFSIIPLVMALWPELVATSHTTLIFGPLISGVVVLGVVWWARDTLTSTVLNRQFAWIAVLLFFAETVLAFGLWLAGVSPPISLLATQFIWATCAAMMAITIDPWFTPGSAAFLIGFLIAARWPAYQLYAVTVANLGFTINGVVRWRPESLQMTERERTWLEARVRTRRGGREARQRPVAGGPAPTSTDDSD